MWEKIKQKLEKKYKAYLVKKTLKIFDRGVKFLTKIEKKYSTRCNSQTDINKRVSYIRELLIELINEI
jgi:hypothetical protein